MTTNDQYLKYLNLAREYPSYFIPLIEKQIDSFINQREMPLEEGLSYETNQGRSVWHEARNFLMNQKSLEPIIKHQGLCNSATDHLQDLCKNGIFGHRGTDGSTFSERILRHCKKGSGSMAEIIGADFNIKDRNTAEMTILSLIIDDGVKDRGHRKTIFSPIYRYVGWCSGKQEEKTITVFNLTQNNLELFYANNPSLTNFVVNNGSKRVSGTSKSPRHYSSTAGNWADSGLKDITNDYTVTKPQWRSPQHLSSFGSSDSSKFGHKKGKKLAQKRQNTKTFYEDRAKIVQATTRLIYNDGSVQQTIDRRTIYKQ